MSNLHDRQLLRKHQYFHYVRSGQRWIFYNMPFLCLMIRSTLVFHRYCLFCSYFNVIVFLSYFYFDLSQPYYWRLAGVEKEKSPVKNFAQEEIYRISQYFHQPKRYFPRVNCFANFFQFFGALWAPRYIYKFRLAVQMLNKWTAAKKISSVKSPSIQVTKNTRDDCESNIS